MARWLGRKEAWAGDAWSAHGLWPELAASPSPTRSGKDMGKLLSCDRLDNNHMLEEGITTHRFHPLVGEEASSVLSKYSIFELINLRFYNLRLL